MVAPHLLEIAIKNIWTTSTTRSAWEVSAGLSSCNMQSAEQIPTIND